MTPAPTAWEIYARAVALAESDPARREVCDVCGGRTTTRTIGHDGVSVIDTPCPRCRGRGWRPAAAPAPTTDPLDAATVVTAALAGVAADLPDGVVDVVRVTAAAVSLAATLRAAGLSPTAALAELDRAFRVCGPAQGARALDAALDAVRLLPPPPPDGPAQGLRSPTSPFGHPAPAEPADGASEPAGETIRGIVDDGPPRGDEVL